MVEQHPDSGTRENALAVAPNKFFPQTLNFLFFLVILYTVKLTDIY